MSLLDFQYQRGGVFLPHLNLWLDPHEAHPGPERVFVSHAHSDHIGNHREVVLTAATAELMRARLAGKRVEHHLAFHERHLFKNGDQEYTLTLLPAGHILGSAMVFIEAGGESLLYTGDFKLSGSLAAEACELRRADTLIMETTFGRPEYVFPPTAEIFQGITRFCREVLNNGETPVLLGYSLGKSQELLRGLLAAGLPLMVHDQVYKLTRIYEQFGQSFPTYQRYDAAQARGHVLVFPPNAPPTDPTLGKLRSAVATGWAIDPSCRFQSRCDAAFPLSDHSDYPELIEFVRRVNPQRVFTLHGFAADFARTLRELGFQAQALSEPEQLSFVLTMEAPAKATRTELSAGKPVAAYPEIAIATPTSNGSFSGFVSACQKIGATCQRPEKIALLADYLRGLDEADLPLVAPWFVENTTAHSIAKPVSLGWAMVRDALQTATGANPTQVQQTFLKHNNLSETVAELLSTQPTATVGSTYAEVAAFFTEFAQATSKPQRLTLLSSYLKRSTANEAQYVVKLLASELRIGLTLSLLEEAISLAFGQALTEVQQAYRLSEDLGLVALHARRGTLPNIRLKLFRPLKNTFAVAEKGGLACQLHKAGDRVVLYTADLQDIAGLFPELMTAAMSLEGSVILNVVLVSSTGELDLAQFQKRAATREPDLFPTPANTLQLVVLDLLWENERAWLLEPDVARREALNALEPWPVLFKRLTVRDSCSTQIRT